ncbi:MAG: diguanylate cyclase, partial [Desulfobacterales bacterium]|nr:diguanylate cyclase [Desulfobacterales bacterium]
MTNLDRQLELAKIRFKTLYELTRMIDCSEKGILDFAMEAGVKVTDSEIGYIYFVSENESELYLHAWSKNVMPQCCIETYPDEYKVSETGLWGEAVRQRKPIITNEYETSPLRRGYPKGHVPVRNHMNLPVFDNDRIVIIAGVGNKKGDYTEEDVQQLSLIMDGTWNIVKRKRLEDELRQTNDNLEKIIDERTSELQKANEELHYIIDKQAQTEVALAKREAIFRGVFDNASAAIVLLSSNGNITNANKICATLLGYTQQELYTKNITDLIHPDDLPEALSKLEGHIKAGDITWQNERKLITKEGKPLWGALYATVLKDKNDDIESLIIVATDITARVTAEHALLKSNLALEKSREQLQIIIDSVPAVISYIDRNLCYQFVNKQYEIMFEQDTSQLIGQHVSSLIGEDLFNRVKHKYNDALAGVSQRFEMDFSNLGKNYILDVSYIPHEFEGVVEGIFILVVDITERKKLENHLAHLSITDPLTGAKNRRFFTETTQKEIERSKRYNASLSLLLLDIDFFKKINDTYGHAAGDQVLKEFVATIEPALRNSDIFCRIGGEEFSILLVETDLKLAKNIAER